MLHETGIRELRRKPVFTTPNVFPPQGARAHDVDRDEPERREASSRSIATSASSITRQIHHFLRSAVPGVRGVEFPQAHRAGGSARARGAADRRAREDRLSGRPQAAARRRAADRHHALPARLGGSATRRSRTSASGAIGWRSSGSTCATRRAWRRSAGICCDTRDAAGFHHQQRLPDRAPPAGFLRAHDGGRNGGAARHAGERAQAARRLRRAARLPYAAGGRRAALAAEPDASPRSPA